CGLLGEHPTTGGEMISVYVKMAQDWQKQINQLRYQIYAAVRDNSTGVVVNDQNDMMEGLLRRVK
ncbi:MAG: terminase, partial [Selenomonadaceae bacterium]|nr:terminase [Selenomonadaceae bacterium]